MILINRELTNAFILCVMMDKKYMTRKEQVCNTEKI